MKYLFVVLAALALFGATVPSQAGSCVTRCDKNSGQCMDELRLKKRHRALRPVATISPDPPKSGNASSGDNGRGVFAF